MERKTFKVEIDIKQRIDKYLTERIKRFSREYIKVLCKKKFVKVNNKCVDPDEKISRGDIVEVTLPERQDYVIGEIKDIEIIYEDECLIVLNKPPFLKVHPAKKFDTEYTLLDILLEKLPDVVKNNWPLLRPFLVHRLDKETSGVIVVAKLPDVQFDLSKQFQRREVTKVYRAIVTGVVEGSRGEIIAPIKKYKNISVVSDIGKEAKTGFRLLSVNHSFKISYLELYPVTGRTHQIRTHLSFINHPIIGDVYYGGVKEVCGKKVPRVMLHSYKIKFFHPRRKKWVEYTAEPPEDFNYFLSLLSL
ncbi:MAG: RluA family pseudouridine synthase [Endomicrobia bacterium]|nr:RluA family pseudouridine synthase [Endomicrobiia bacterium]